MFMQQNHKNVMNQKLGPASTTFKEEANTIMMKVLKNDRIKRQEIFLKKGKFLKHFNELQMDIVNKQALNEGFAAEKKDFMK
jgi:hypothetical protein